MPCRPQEVMLYRLHIRKADSWESALTRQKRWSRTELWRDPQAGETVCLGTGYGAGGPLLESRQLQGSSCVIISAGIVARMTAAAARRTSSAPPARATMPARANDACCARRRAHVHEHDARVLRAPRRGGVLDCLGCPSSLGNTTGQSKATQGNLPPKDPGHSHVLALHLYGSGTGLALYSDCCTGTKLVPC